jgi:hypothetical protein
VRFEVVPVTLEDANAFVRAIHRHHGPVIGHKFSLGIADEGGNVRGVAIVSRPTGRLNDNGWTLEVTRLATDGCKNGCSQLYGAARRATFALGYKRLITYILANEPGTSLKAAGWRCLGEAGGGSWNRRDRPRVDRHPLGVKQLFETVAPTDTHKEPYRK